METNGFRRRALSWLALCVGALTYLAPTKAVAGASTRIDLTVYGCAKDPWHYNASYDGEPVCFRVELAAPDGMVNADVEGILAQAQVRLVEERFWDFSPGDDWPAKEGRCQWLRERAARYSPVPPLTVSVLPPSSQKPYGDDLRTLLGAAEARLPAEMRLPVGTYSILVTLQDSRLASVFRPAVDFPDFLFVKQVWIHRPVVSDSDRIVVQQGRFFGAVAEERWQDMHAAAVALVALSPSPDTHRQLSSACEHIEDWPCAAANLDVAADLEEAKVAAGLPPSEADWRISNWRARAAAIRAQVIGSPPP